MTEAELRRLARVGASACWLIALAVASTTALSVWTLPAARLFAPLGFASLDHAAAWQLIAARGLASVPSIVGAAAVVTLGSCFRSIARGQLFASGTVQGLARFAAWIVAAVVVSVAVPTVSGLVLSLGAAPGQGRLVVSLGSQQVLAVLAAGAFWMLSRLLAVAARLERENAEFV